MTTTLDIRDNLPAASAVRQGDAAAAVGGATTPAVAVAPLDVLVDYCQSAGRGISFGRWPRSLIREYLKFHRNQGTLHVETCGDQIAGVLIAWRGFAREVQARHELNLPLFSWESERRFGDCAIVAQAIATAPGALARLTRTGLRRYPDWQTLPVFTYRYKQLRRYSPRLIHHVKQGTLC